MIDKKILVVIVLISLLAGSAVTFFLQSNVAPSVEEKEIGTAVKSDVSENFAAQWVCPIGTGGTVTVFRITSVSPTIAGTVSGKNSGSQYVKEWGPVNIGVGPGTVQAVPAGEGITFTMPSGSTYSNFRLNESDAQVEFRSAIEGIERRLTCTRG